MRSIGFTGSRADMTNEQLIQVHMLLGDFKSAGALSARHGLCLGADRRFHQMAEALKYHMEGHPGVNYKGQVSQRATDCRCDVVWPERFFLDRNLDIVNASSVMLATPKEVEEQMRGSGTWQTIRYARKMKHPLVIIWPDGSLKVEFIPGYFEGMDRLQLIAHATKNW